MLERLNFRHVGPGPELAIRFQERLNFITGDNGLGKTFILDAAWWALTRSWARGALVPHVPPSEPTITYAYGTRSGKHFEHTSEYDRAAEQWSPKPGRPAIPGMVIYAQVDGGFSVWDPARNYWKKGNPERPASYLFTAQEVWEGNALCEGLIRDWASWQREDGDAFAHLRAVLRVLSPSHRDGLVPGDLRKVSLSDPRRHPTLKMPYGQDVPLVHASAGMRRIVALAYLLVWTWTEHLEACKLLGQQPVKEIIFLVDEIEAHLHPQWQRRIVPALLEVMETMTGDHDSRVQLITCSHSPLVLASAEPAFDERRDGLFHLARHGDAVSFDAQPWAKQGDVVNWLVSETFGLSQGRSLEAERAIEAAEAWMRGSLGDLPDELATQSAIHDELLRVLAGHDPFWPRWIVHRESKP